MSASQSFPRRPYSGSCHCGLVRYVAWLQFVDSNTDVTSIERSTALNGHEIYRCNCTTCQKLSILHLRLPNAPDDFAVTAPLLPDGSGLKMEQDGDKERGLRTYRCFKKTQDWYFCGNCGVRCFTIRGDCEAGTASIPTSLLSVPSAAEGNEPQQKSVSQETREVPVWRPKREGWKESYPCYLSINATSLDIHQEGLDLRNWHTNGWVMYHDYLTGSGKSSMEPFEGGFH